MATGAASWFPWMAVTMPSRQPASSSRAKWTSSTLRWAEFEAHRISSSKRARSAPRACSRARSSRWGVDSRWGSPESERRRGASARTTRPAPMPWATPFPDHQRPPARSTSRGTTVEVRFTGARARSQCRKGPVKKAIRSTRTSPPWPPSPSTMRIRQGSPRRVSVASSPSTLSMGALRPVRSFTNSSRAGCAMARSRRAAAGQACRPPARGKAKA